MKQQIRKRISSGARNEGYLNTRHFLKTDEPVPLLSSQQSAERTAHDGAADRTADRAPDRLAEVGSHPADHLIGNRSGDVAGDDLAGRQPAARRAGAENRADDGADLPQYSAAASV